MQVTGLPVVACVSSISNIFDKLRLMWQGVSHEHDSRCRDGCFGVDFAVRMH
jgi:hypothetical protein